MARVPGLAEAVGGVMAALRPAGALTPRMMELVRLRIAFHNQCRSCMAVRYQSAIDDGLTEQAVCSLERPAEAADLSQAERAALDFADRFATDHLGIDDAVYDELRQNFSEDELVQLGVQCAMFVGIGRIAATWNVVEDVPDELRTGATGSVTPWMIPGEVASG
jgi:AhpD family alkylhydroperoxidase